MASEADQDMATRFGVSPASIAAIRAQSLIEGEHWKKEGRAMVYLPAGETLLSELLAAEKKEGGPPAPESSPEPEKKEGRADPEPPATAAEAKAEPVEASLMVVKIHRNPAYVDVRAPDGRPHTVKIRATGRLKRGHRILCRLTDGQWQCIQSRLQARR